jgi:hypothetical protein
MTTLQQMAEGQNNAHVVFNENCDTLSAGALYGKDPATTAALTWGYLGGLYNGNTVASGTVALTNAATNYVVVRRSTGVVSVSTTSTNSVDPLYAKLYKLTTAGGVVTAALDQRWDTNGLFFSTGGAASTYAALTDAATVDLPTVNAPLAAALATKADVLAPGTAITATGNLSHASHANRQTPATGAGGYTLTIRNDSTGGWVTDDSIEIVNKTSGALTFAGGTATLTAATGYKLTAVAGEVFTAQRVGADTWYSTTPDPSSATGVVTSVAASVPTFLSVSGSPITSTGTLAISYSGTALPVANGGTGGTSASAARTALGVAIGSDVQAFDADLSTIAGLTATTDSFLQAKSSAWASRTVAQVSADLQGTGLLTDAVGFRTIPQNSQSAAYTTVAADAGKHLLHPAADTTARTFTIDSNANVAYPVGTAITFVNEHAAGVMTIAITSDTMRLAGAGTTGSRTLAADGIATALKITSTSWIVSGTGLT